MKLLNFPLRKDIKGNNSLIELFAYEIIVRSPSSGKFPLKWKINNVQIMQGIVLFDIFYNCHNYISDVRDVKLIIECEIYCQIFL